MTTHECVGIYTARRPSHVSEVIERCFGPRCDV
jgi:hypothetical protein